MILYFKNRRSFYFFEEVELLFRRSIGLPAGLLVFAVSVDAGAEASAFPSLQGSAFSVAESNGLLDEANKAVDTKIIERLDTIIRFIRSSSSLLLKMLRPS